MQLQNQPSVCHSFPRDWGETNKKLKTRHRFSDSFSSFHPAGGSKSPSQAFSPSRVIHVFAPAFSSDEFRARLCYRKRPHRAGFPVNRALLCRWRQMCIPLSHCHSPLCPEGRLISTNRREYRGHGQSKEREKRKEMAGSSKE